MLDKEAAAEAVEALKITIRLPLPQRKEEEVKRKMEAADLAIQTTLLRHAAASIIAGAVGHIIAGAHSIALGPRTWPHISPTTTGIEVVASLQILA